MLLHFLVVIVLVGLRLVTSRNCSSLKDTVFSGVYGLSKLLVSILFRLNKSPRGCRCNLGAFCFSFFCFVSKNCCYERFWILYLRCIFFGSTRDNVCMEMGNGCSCVNHFSKTHQNCGSFYPYFYAKFGEQREQFIAGA